MEDYTRGGPADIVVLSDSDTDSDDEAGLFATPQSTLSDDLVALDSPQGYGSDLADHALLQHIPDEDVPPSPAPRQPTASDPKAEPITEAECLQRVLNIFPDISVDHVLSKIGERGQCTSQWCERFIGEILDTPAYPKERDQIKLKRKRSDSQEDDVTIAEYENAGMENEDAAYFLQAVHILQDEFRDIPVRHIQSTLRRHNSLFKAYSILDEQLRNYETLTELPFSKVRLRNAKRARTTGSQDLPEDLMARLTKELKAAQKKRDKVNAQGKTEEEKKRLEEENIRIARLNDDMLECPCCCDEYPTNRMTYCDGLIMHFFCKECASRYVEEEIGKSRCRPKCFAGQDNCTATFTRQQLQSFLEPKVFERLERLQQQEELRAAGLENLEDCPFCDFQAECPPVEIDREFRCQNPECGKTSCRLCRLETHIPLTCEEYKKDNKIQMKHAVEEAMTQALVRTCNKCKNPFIKDYGCNKMACTKCGNMQCYVCSENVKNYDHFSHRAGDGRCPLHDNTTDRHDEEVKKAEAAALALLRAEHPEMSEAELKVEFSNRVQDDDAARRRRDAGLLGPQFPAYPIHPPPPPLHIPFVGGPGVGPIAFHPAPMPQHHAPGFQIHIPGVHVHIPPGGHAMYQYPNPVVQANPNQAGNQQHAQPPNPGVQAVRTLQQMREQLQEQEQQQQIRQARQHRIQHQEQARQERRQEEQEIMQRVRQRQQERERLRQQHDQARNEARRQVQAQIDAQGAQLAERLAALRRQFQGI